MTLYHIRVCEMERPVGIDGNPYFSWMLRSTARNTLQAGYQIIVKDDTGVCVWDSQYVATRQNSFVEYEGLPLKSRMRYHVDIQVWDNHGNNAVAHTSYEMGLLHQTDWQASWVENRIRRKKGKPGFGHQEPASLFRKEFTIHEVPQKARLYLTCHGVYQLFINGKRISDVEFAPEHTVYEKYLCYQTYDITDCLKKGINTIGVHVGDGWYLCPNAHPNMKYRNAHAVLFQIETQGDSGSREIVVSDEQMRACYGPVRSSDLFAGEKYDANYACTGWNENGYDDSHWVKVRKLKQSLHNLVAQYGEGVRKVMHLPVQKVLHNEKGETILDFGQVIAGRISARIAEEKGKEIVFEHCEVLNQDGEFFNNILSAGNTGNGCEQKDIYISNGSAAIFEPIFTYHGFRYVKVSGITDVRKENFQAEVLSTPMESVGTFKTSDDRLNRLYENILWSQRANMISIPTDCPQREKAGWTGDMLVYSRTAMQNANCTCFFTRWLRNMQLDQGEDGNIPVVVPYDGFYPKNDRLSNFLNGIKGPGTSAGWGDAAVVVPYNMYFLTGNTLILRQQYSCMKKWCDYILHRANTKKPKKSNRSKDIEMWLWDTDFHFGEWLIPSQNKNGMKMDLEYLRQIKASAYYTAPIFGWNSIRLLAQIAQIIGEKQDAERYAAYAEKMKRAIQLGILDSYDDIHKKLMGAYVLPIYFDLVADERREEFAAALVDLIKENDYCLDTGFLATPYLLDALCKIQRKDIAYKILTQTKAPSWFHEIENGATTIWESWFGYDSDGNPGNLSFNHYAYGSVGDWMFRHIGGIDTNTSGYMNILIRPDYMSEIQEADRSYVTPNGMVRCHWKKHENEILLDAEIPCNATASIYLPDGTLQKVGSGTYRYCEQQ